MELLKYPVDTSTTIVLTARLHRYSTNCIDDESEMT